MKTSIKPIVTGVSAAFLLGASSLAMASDNPFQANQLESGYALVAQVNKDKEGKCGEGKCGANKAAASKSAEGKCGEGKCGSK